jgi:hypothetical protein
MTVRCACKNCRGSIAFDAADFAEQSRTSTQVIGQNVRCPHCGYATPIMMSIERWSKVSSAEGAGAGPGIIILLILLIALIPGIIVFGLIRSGATVKQIATGGAGAPGLIAVAIVGIVALITAIMWLIFPWVAWARLSKIHAELRKIEQRMRRPQQTGE